MSKITKASLNIRFLVVTVVSLSITFQCFPTPNLEARRPQAVWSAQAAAPPTQRWADKIPIDLAARIAANRSQRRRQDVIIQFNTPLVAGHLSLLTRRGGIIKHRFGGGDAVLASAKST